MKFIGIDLGWTSGASGLCCLSWHNQQLKIVEITTKLELTAIFAWLDRTVPPQESALIAVDAPTIIPNQTGMRLPDKLTHKYFGRYHAGCYPANLNRPFAQKTVNFGLSLAARNYRHAPTIVPQKLGRYQIEVFPHPATVNLFKLERIIKYKKGKLAERTGELKRLHHYIQDILPQLEPSLDITNLPAIANLVTGKDLKAIEDQLDSLICAYIAAHWWYWGTKKNLVLGDETTGYIVIPHPYYLHH